MKLRALFFSIALPALFVSTAIAATPRPMCERPMPPGALPDWVNPNAPQLRADTTWFGDYQIIGGEYHARSSGTKADVAWTFDRGNGPTGDPSRITNGEGWKALQVLGASSPFRIADASLDLGPGVHPPIIAGTKSLWAGVDNPEARSLCWVCGSGYGNNMCQRIVSEELAYSGSGNVSLAFLYFNNTEPCYDGTQVYLRRADGTELLLNPTSASCDDNPIFLETGGFTDSIGSWDHPAAFSRPILQSEIGSAQGIRFVIEFRSDGGYSDEDGGFCTTFGPFGADNIVIAGGGINASYDFEMGLGAWTPVSCDSHVTEAGIADVGCYTILDPCACRLSGNVLEMHAGLCDDGFHPDGQHEVIESPICDVGDGTTPKEIFLELEMYALLPQEDCVFTRVGWKYYPFTCNLTGETGWSPRVAGAYQYQGSDPHCMTWRYSATASGLVPSNSRKVIAILELLSDCSVFTISGSGETNLTPLYDNLAVAATRAANAPALTFENGTNFRDVGSYPSNLFDPRAPGPANVSLDKYMDTPNMPDLSGDTLVVAGPTVGSDPNKRWEARLWWRVAQKAPLQSDRAQGVSTRYKIWRDNVADGRQIDRPDRPEFAWGWMDSVQSGTLALRNKFLSAFREDDDDFAGEGNPDNEMIWDDILYPGTRIEYFITGNYISSPSALRYLPDTTGGYFLEFEVLPGLRMVNMPGCDGGGTQVCVYQPATLYVDSYNVRAQIFIENALRTILNGEPPCTEPGGCRRPPIPYWDRYDYSDACS
jgi:hypothetical protein